MPSQAFARARAQGADPQHQELLLIELLAERHVVIGNTLNGHLAFQVETPLWQVFLRSRMSAFGQQHQ